jgi:hypothetical protein
MKKDQNWPQESINNKEDLITQLDVNEKPRKMDGHEQRPNWPQESHQQ